jgi:DNA-binding protein Fis
MLLVEAEPPRETGPVDGPNGLNLQQVERRTIVQAMDLADSNQRKAARMLHVHRATLARKLKKHKLT